MTDTAYLYQYFLKNSPSKKASDTKENKNEGTKPDDKEEKRFGNHNKQRV